MSKPIIDLGKYWIRFDEAGSIDISSNNGASWSNMAGSLADGSVTTAKLADAAVTAAKLAAAAVSTTALADGGVTAAKLAAAAVGTTALADGGVTAAKLAAGSVGTTALDDGGVTAAKLAAGVGGLKFAFGSYNGDATLSRLITVGFTPKVVAVAGANAAPTDWTGLWWIVSATTALQWFQNASTDKPISLGQMPTDGTGGSLDVNGFKTGSNGNYAGNVSGTTYAWMAWG